MLSGIIGKKTVYIVTGYTDMRKGIDGLAAIVQGKLSLDPYSKALFLFCGKNPRKLRTCLHKLKSTQQGLQIGNNTNIFLVKRPNFIVL